MWRPDVIDLRDFYAGHLGQTTQRLIRRRLREVWSDVRGQRILGIGFASPYLRPFRETAERVIAIMPAAQGVIHWPREGPSAVTLAEDTELPLADASIDRVLLVHGLENTEDVRALLREIWRVLTPSGRLLVVVPNRRGLWAMTETTPFGHGQPYTQPQLQGLLRDALFVPDQGGGALYVPPIRRRFVLRGALAWEQLGRRWLPKLAGVIVLEAGKQIYALTASRPRRLRVPRLVPVRRGLSSGHAARHGAGPATDRLANRRHPPSN